MKVLPRIVEPIAVDVMHNLARLGPRDLAMLPLTAGAARTVPQPKVSLLLPLSVTIRFLNRGIGGDSGRDVGDRADHAIAAPVVLSTRQPAHLLLVGIERIAMLAIHLVVPPAHLLRHRWPLAELARSPDDLPAPAIIWRPMLLLTLVVHQAKAVSGVLSLAALNAARSVLLRRCHVEAIPHALAPNKLGGNFINWIGERIEAIRAATGGHE